MMTRPRSTPSCAKIACCASPDRPAAHVWVEVGQLPLGERQDRGAVPEVRPVLLDAGRARDDVLVHERRTELGRGHRPERGLHRGHARQPLAPAAARSMRSFAPAWMNGKNGAIATRTPIFV